VNIRTRAEALERARELFEENRAHFESCYPGYFVAFDVTSGKAYIHRTAELAEASAVRSVTEELAYDGQPPPDLMDFVVFPISSQD
jgi:hypothetical protein